MCGLLTRLYPEQAEVVAAVIAADITLNAGEQVTIKLKQIPAPIVLAYQAGVDYRIAIKNYEPPGVLPYQNHLGLLNDGLVLTGETIYQFDSRDENVDIDPAHDWDYPNIRPPKNCPAATLGISFPIPIA